MTTYHFAAKLREGHEGEQFLDELFCRWYAISEPLNAQRHGIDRQFNALAGSREFTVEYKCDRTASRTGNAFVETVSVDYANKPGWAITSEADYLAYYVPSPDVVYVIRMPRLQARVGEWSDSYPTRSVRNDGYLTKGVLVPLHEFERIAEVVL